MQIFRISNVIHGGATIISMRCPRCKKQGVFTTLELSGNQILHDVVITPPGDLTPENRQLFFGQRRCPNPDCHAHVFIVADQSRKLVVSYPPELVDFDPANLPEPVLKALSEAIQCHAINCDVAAAIMLRKTLEEVCADKKVTGKNIMDRITALSSAVTFPKSFLDGMHLLRLLGNDAAHIESKTYDDVGHEEVSTALEVIKMILWAIYQTDSIAQKLETLKKTP